MTCNAMGLVIMMNYKIFVFVIMDKLDKTALTTKQKKLYVQVFYKNINKFIKLYIY